jgi:hypothetical protein
VNVATAKRALAARTLWTLTAEAKRARIEAGA